MYHQYTCATKYFDHFVNCLALPLWPSFCRVLVSDRDSRVAPCFCPSRHDFVRPRRPRSHHRLPLPFRLFLLVRAHDRGRGRDHVHDCVSDHVCHARPPHVRVRTEALASRCDSDFDCKRSDRTRTIWRGACCQKTRVSRASFPSFLARKDRKERKKKKLEREVCISKVMERGAFGTYIPIDHNPEPLYLFVHPAFECAQVSSCTYLI